VGTSRRVGGSAWGLVLVLFFGGRGGALAEPPGGAEAGGSTNSPTSTNDAPKSLPQNGIFSSLKQSAQQDLSHEAVRAHFDLGSPPNVRRYYCLVNTKTGNREPNAVLGEPVPHDGGMTGIKSVSVSLYSCADAEQQGMLVTSGYVLSGTAKSAPAPAPSAQTAAQAAPPPAASADGVDASSNLNGSAIPANPVYRLAFPPVLISRTEGERIEKLNVNVSCGRFVGISNIPNDWSVSVMNPEAERTTLASEATHTAAGLGEMLQWNGSIVIAVTNPSCFDVSAVMESGRQDARGKELETRREFKRSEMKFQSVSGPSSK